MTLYSPAYAALQSQFHLDTPEYGISGTRYSEQILQMANRLQTRSLLDYGCGKCTLQKALPFPIQNYDPFIPEHAVRPEPADIVVCTDVMEHIEPEYVEAVLTDIAALTNKAAFFQIDIKPAKKILPDGRNAHITLRSSNWWLQQLMACFDIKSMQMQGNGFVVVAAPLGTFSPTAELG